jgi:hypothetical protein
MIIKMERVVFTGPWKQILAENGLKTFRDIYYCRNKFNINRNRKRNVCIIRLKVAGVEKNLYLKRFRHSHFKDMLFIFLNRGRLCSQAAYEWSNIKLLARNKIGSQQRVCFGEHLRFGYERRSFIMTEELKGLCLTDFVAQNWEKFPASEKEKIIVALAHTVQKIHKAGISMPDLYLWHIFISKDKNAGGDDEYSFAFLDLNRMKRNATDENERIKNLGRLHYSMIDKYFDDSMRMLLLETYAAAAGNSQIDKLVSRVKKYSRKYSARKRIRRY